MKFLRILILAAVALACMLPASGRRMPGEKVGVSFGELVYEFGIVAEDGEPVVHDFEYTNTGTTPLAVVWAKASCGCTSPKYDRKPLQPGQSAVITVKFLPKGQFGEVDKSVRVRFKNGNGKAEQVTLRLIGTVTPTQK